MNKLERVDAVLSGEKPDRPPLSLWYHFGVQHGSGEQFARLSLEYFRYYDLDYLKVMNDYFYPPPAGVETIKDADGLAKLTLLNLDQTDWVEQFKALALLHAELKNEAYYIDTVFDPWQSIRRNMAGENMKILMDEYPDALLKALDVVADNLIAYSKRSLEIGSSGIFMSVPSASEIISHDNFLKFVKPPAMKVFAALFDLGRLNTAHIHGDDLYFDDCLDFPVQAFSWWDRGPHGPSMESVKSKTNACVMGGIDQTLVARTSPGFLKNHVREGIELGGDTRFFLANGCSIETWTYPGSIKAIVEANRTAK